MIEQKIVEIYRSVFRQEVVCTEELYTNCEMPTKQWRTDGTIPVEVHLDLEYALETDPDIKEISVMIYPDHMGGGEGLVCEPYNGCYWGDTKVGYAPPDRLQWEEFARQVWDFFCSLPESEIKRLHDEATIAANGRKAINDKYFEANPELMRYFPNGADYPIEQDFYDDCWKYLTQRGIVAA